MFGNNIVRPFTLTRVLSGISRSLNFANQVIPIYQQAKPMINNARQVISAIREFAHSDTPIVPAKKEIKKTVLENKVTNSSNPVFFQ